MNCMQCKLKYAIDMEAVTFDSRGKDRVKQELSGKKKRHGIKLCQLNSFK